MKKFLYILFFISQTVFCQVEIDTSILARERIEYQINWKNNDTTKWRTTEFYQSGLIKETLHLDSVSNEVSIFLNEVKPYEFDKGTDLIYAKLGQGEDSFILRNYLNKKNIIDSTKIKYGGGEGKDTSFVSVKKYYPSGKLKEIQTWEGTYFYKYGFFGKVKKIEFSSGHNNKTSYYKNGLLQRIDAKNPLIRIDSIKYNKAKKPIRVDRRFEYIIFKYDDQRRLIEKSTYRKGQKKIPIEKVNYKYENGNLKSEDTFLRGGKKISSSYFVYKNEP